VVVVVIEEAVLDEDVLEVIVVVMDATVDVVEVAVIADCA